MISSHMYYSFCYYSSGRFKSQTEEAIDSFAMVLYCYYYFYLFKKKKNLLERKNNKSPVWKVCL